MRIEPEQVRALCAHLRKLGVEIADEVEEDAEAEFDRVMRSSSHAFYDSMPLGEARHLLHAKALEGTQCPCCGQNAKRYSRKVNSSMARTLIAMYRTGGTSTFVHTPSLASDDLDTHEASQLSWWGLIEEERVKRSDGGRAGYWRVTRKGEAWIFGKVRITKKALVYDSEVLGFEGDPVTIEDALGTKFNYMELMAGV